MFKLILAREIVLVFVLFLSVIFDLRVRRIPNWLTVPGVMAGLLLNGLEGFAQFLHSFLGLMVGVGVLIVPFALGWLGAGDVKLFGMVGAVLGVQWIPRVLFYSGVMSGMLAVFVVIMRGVNLKAFPRMWMDLKVFVMSLGQVLPEGVSQRTSHKKSIPWAVAIGLGVVVAFYLDADGKWAGF